MSITATRPLTLITGASQGIGADFARIFASKGHDLALVARNGTRLNEVADEISAKGGPRPLVIPLDLSLPGAAGRLVAALRAEGGSVQVLVNNAGFGLLGDFADVDSKGHLEIIDLNIRVLVEMTALFLPEITAAKGKILNVASIAAFIPGPGLSVYYATKAFVLRFSQALSHEMKKHGVVVSCLCPGPVTTGFQARAGFTPGLLLMKLSTMDSITVAKIGYRGLMAGNRVNIAGWGNKVILGAVRLTPHSLLLPILAFMQKSRNVKNP